MCLLCRERPEWGVVNLDKLTYRLRWTLRKQRVCERLSKLNARCIYISTDYVFDGEREERY